ncbi:MAG: HAD family hydrolase [Rhizobiaceae bacterium]
MIKAILFDKDGTLIDFVATFAPATQAVIENLSGGDQQIAQKMADAVTFDLDTMGIAPDAILIAGSLQDISDCWFPHVTETDGAAFLARVDRLYVEYSLESLVPFQSLKPILKTLQSTGFSLGIATNDSEMAAQSHMQKLGLETAFDFIAGFDSGHGEKPESGMVTAFARHCSLPPSQVAMVGDSVHDCTAGRAAGACVVAVTSGLASYEDLQPHADHVISGIAQLPMLVHQLNMSEGVM